MDFFQKGGGGSEAIQKFWDTFCAPTILVKYNTKSAPKVPGKKSAYEKVSQKFQKSGGGGGKTFLEEVHN